MGFFERSKQMIQEGMESTKEILEKTKEKTKEIGEMGVLKYAIKQLESQAEKRFAEIGRQVYENL